MTNKLWNTFKDYTNAIKTKLQKRTDNSSHLYINEDIEIRELVDQLESEDTFHKLVLETCSSFSGDFHKQSEIAFKETVKNFFRRSNYYIDIYDGKNLNDDTFFQNFQDAFNKRTTEITYLALMEFVQFSEKCMDFKTFQIRKFKKSELEETFQNMINRIFYPYALIDIAQLEHHWFIYVKETCKAERLGYLNINFKDFYHVRMEYTQFPKCIESVLKVITLFDWQADCWRNYSEQRYNIQKRDLEEGWLGFNIPVILKLNDSLLNTPKWPPHIPLLTIPKTDPQTDEEIGVEPAETYIYLDKKETKSFIVFINNIEEPMQNIDIQKNNWQFIEVALGYLVKAFFAERLDQLLCHITVLEALLGDKERGFTRRIANRIASILGATYNEKKTIKKQFDKLYDIRCDLVHGKQLSRDVYIGHLSNARNLSRKTILWFLNLLNHIQKNLLVNHISRNIPSRENILSVLDLDQNNRSKVHQLIENLPSGFPNVPDWFE